MRCSSAARSACGIVLACVLSSGWLAASADGSPSHIWFSDHKSLKAVDTTTNQVDVAVEARNPPVALGADNDGNVWSASANGLTKVDPSGVTLIDLDLKKFNGSVKQPRFLAVNPYRNSVWVASNHDVMLLSSGAEKLAEWHSEEEIEGVALDIDESLWILGYRELMHLSQSGALIRTVSIDANAPDPERMVIDGLGGTLWVVANRKLLKFDVNQPDVAPAIFDLPIKIRAADVHPVFGTLWLAGDAELLMFDRNGQALAPLALPADLGSVNDLKYDAKGSALWIAGKKSVLRLTSAGESQATVAVDKEAAILGVGGSRLAPTLAIVSPADGALTNDPRPRIQLSLGSRCSEVPCLLPPSYFQSMTLDILLNGTPIGSLFDGPASAPGYLPPTRLPEGQNVIGGSAVDLFGHRSAEVSARFVIDTVPPTFLNVTPPDGSTSADANITVSGSVDDATANVMLGDGGGNVSMSGANFIFAVELKPGANAFTLTATDPAGNTSQFPLNLTYQPSQGLQIAQPLPGSTVPSDVVTITGTFGTGPNTGITVNGVAAEIVGDQFVANIHLSPGLNTITVVATTLDGAVEQQQFTVTSSGTASIGVDQVEPRRALMENFAGTGEAGYSGDNGPAKAAQLDFPDVLAVAPDGSVYISVSGTGVVRRVSSDGTITTVAGNGGFESAGDGGPATAASFGTVASIAFAPDGSWYVTDGAKIRRVDTNGIIDRVAGLSFGFEGDGGPASDARFSDYLRLAVAPDGTIYVADYFNNRIRRIDTNGIVTTIAGGDDPGYAGDGGPAADALIGSPDSLARAPDGSLYFFDSSNYVVRRIDPAGVITTIAGNGSFGDSTDPASATTAPLGYIVAIAFDAMGNTYLLDNDFSKVRRVNTEDVLETVAGTGDSGDAGDGGPPAQAAFSFPYAMALGADGTLFVADSGNNRVRDFNVLLSDADTTPLTAGFRLTPDTGIAVSRIDADFDGDGRIDATVASDRAPLQFVYPQPGVYTAKFTVTDTLGNTYDVLTTVVIKDVNAADDMFRAIFKTMLDRLRVGKVDGALNVVTGGMRNKYSAVFNALKPNLATVVDRIGTLKSGLIGEEFAEYALVREQGDQSQAFLIYFIKCEDGVWRIDGM